MSTDGEGMAPMCGERRYLAADLVQEALGFESPKKQRGADSVERALRCTLQEHGPVHDPWGAWQDRLSLPPA